MALFPPESRMRMEDVARALRVTASTVSRALRDDPRISATMRARVKAAAREMGYRPHPLVQALMTQRRTRRVRTVETIALVTSHAEESWRTKDVCRWYMHGLRRGAEHHGYRLEVFPLDAYHDCPSRLAQVLHARGILGVILAFSRDRTETTDFPVEHFCVVGVSTYFGRVAVDRVNLNGFANVKLAFAQLRKAGYKQPGLVVPTRNNAVVGGLWSAAALDEQWQRPADESCPPLIVGDSRRVRDEFVHWFKAHLPDAVLAYKVPVRELLAGIGARVPEEVGVAYLFGTEEERASMAGIDGQLDQVGAAAVDLLVQKLGLHAEGRPAHPRDILITGSWQEGPTIRPRTEAPARA
jgi:DNA-binding LacI/PurR family transcriptional regulator